jgi:16S rRNA (cytosine967-C5)-methyltransferase
VLHQLRERDAFAQDLIDKAIDDSRLPREEKAFVTVLVLGVVSTRGTLDEILNACLDSPSDISPAVRDALQISTYEIIYLEKSPHAAVDQGVELVRSIAPKASGLANAVLRRVVRARDNFPFGDPRTDLTAYSRLHGFPQWLTERLLKELGPQDAHAFMKASNEPAPIFISINPAQATDAEVIEVLAQAHGNPRPVQVEGHAVQGCYRLESGVVLHDGRVRRLLNKGCLLVSDATSQAVAGCVVGATLPDSFLEIGAGRATKTILDQGVALRRFNKQIPTYVTVDNHAFKTKLLKQRAEQFGIEVSEALTGDARAIASLVEGRTFDTIFIDAPCSGLGTLRRHPEIRWRITPDTFNEMAALDEELLSACAPLVKSAGRVCYATCTITREENDQVILKFLQSEAGKGFVLVNPFNEEETFEVVGMDSLPEGSCLRVKLEPGGSDAHFLAILKRVSE